MFAKKLEVVRSKSVRRSFSLGAVPSRAVGVGERPPLTFELDWLPFVALPLCFAPFAAPALPLMQTSRLINNVWAVLSRRAASEVL